MTVTAPSSRGGVLKKQLISVEDFKRYIPRLRCINLFHYNFLNSSKLKEISSIERVDFESVEDFENLRDDMLVWYVNDRGEPAYWNSENARNLRLEEQAARCLNDGMDEAMRGLVDSLRGGLTNHVEIISVYDTLLKKRVIVDGVKRAVALYYLYLTDRDVLSALLGSRYQVSCVIFSSPAGSLIFPCDFVNICRDMPAGDSQKPEI
jgi:hypothetical protein